MNTAAVFTVFALGLLAEHPLQAQREADFFAIKPIREVEPYQDVRFKDLSGIDRRPGRIWRPHCGSTKKPSGRHICPPESIQANCFAPE
jgi:hypothetical protein